MDSSRGIGMRGGRPPPPRSYFDGAQDEWPRIGEGHRPIPFLRPPSTGSGQASTMLRANGILRPEGWIPALGGRNDGLGGFWGWGEEVLRERVW